MFKQSTIDKINELDLVDVIGKYVQLKKAGASWVGKSPFTDEKTGSFRVSPSKNVWKCFSTGKGGNSPISFIIEANNLTFPEAINELAGRFGIELEMDNEKGAKVQQRAEKIRSINELNQLALEFWNNQLVDENGDLRAGLTPEVIKQASRASKTQIDRFQLGYAPDSSNSLLKHLAGKGISFEQMADAGLINIKTETDEKGVERTKQYDCFRNRIMFPIYDHSGRLVAFSGRSIVWDKESKFPKVLNTKETAAYTKSNTLLGISIAKSEIISAGFAVRVEGNFDVTAFHEKGLNNTVAMLGSAFTKEQASILKRFTQSLVLAVDNDKAGLKKVKQDVETALEAGLYCEVWMSDVENEDPFDYCVSFNDELDFIEVFKNSKTDAVEYVASLLFEEGQNIQQKTQAQKQLVELVSKIQDPGLRNNYIADFIKKYGITKKDVEDTVSVEQASKKAKEMEKSAGLGIKLPSHLTQEAFEEFKEFRFYSDKGQKTIGYYFPSGDGTKQVSNCLLNPLFQVESINDSKRIVELSAFVQEKKFNKLIELPDKAFVSQNDLQTILARSGPFWFHGTKLNFQSLVTKLFPQFPIAREIRTLGWQREGFFAFANGIVETNFKAVNDYGLCIHGEQKYFLPAFSSIYANVQAEDDSYENDRKFIYKKSGVKFDQWASLFYKVYQHNNNGMVAIAYLLSSLFSDHIHGINNDFPILFGFGQPKTGKTTCARSISRVFKSDTTPFSLNHGTHVAFNRRLARIRNGIEHLDEYQNDLDEKKFQGLKAIFDRMGHEKGVMSNDNRTTTTQISSAAFVTGQHQPTRDGNSLYTRIIMLIFDQFAQDFTQEQNKLFQELSHMEKGGLSDIIVQVVQYRSLIETEFENLQFEIAKQMKDDLRNESVDGRVMKNLVVLCAMVQILGEKIGLPFTFSDFYEEAKRIVITQSIVISDSDQLAEFFKMIEFLYHDNKLSYGSDFVIEEVKSIQSRNGSKGTETISFTEITKVVHFKFTRIYPLYSENMKKQKGEFGLPETTIKSYMKSHPAFIGTPAVVNFNGNKTSAYTFDLGKLPISIERTVNEIPNPVPSPPITQNFNTPAIVKEGYNQLTLENESNTDEDLPF